MSQIFISYRRAYSSGYVLTLYEHLATTFGDKNIFRDIDNIGPGENFPMALENALLSCQAAIIVIGKHWLTVTDTKGQPRLNNPNDYVRLEVASSLKRDIIVIPVLVGGASMPAEGNLPDDLKPLVRLNALEVNDRSYKYDIEHILSELDEALGITRREQIHGKIRTASNSQAKVATHNLQTAEIQPTINELANLFDFTQSELELNRNGRISQRQKDINQKLRKNYILRQVILNFIGLSVYTIIGLSILSHEGIISKLFGWLCLGNLSIVLILLLILFKRFFTKPQAIQTVSGALTVNKKAVKVGGVSISTNTAKALKQLDIDRLQLREKSYPGSYRAYYLKTKLEISWFKKNTLLSIIPEHK